jgi:flavodoxin
MAESIVDGLAQEGIEARPMHLRANHRSDIMTEILDAGAVVVGSPTLNNGLYPTVSDFLTYMKGLKPKKKIAAAFGSFGWAGGAVKEIEESIAKAGIGLAFPGIGVKYVPDENEEKKCYDFGKDFAAGAVAKILANVNAGTSRAPQYEMKQFDTEVLSDTVLTVELDRGFAPSPRLRTVVVVNPDGGESTPLILTVIRRQP